MRLTQATRSGTHALQALISGSVIDTVTGVAPNAPVTIRLLVDATDEPYPLAAKVADDGAFAFFGKPVSAFPPSPDPYNLWIEASAPRYESARFDLLDIVVPIAANPADQLPMPQPRLEGLDIVEPASVRLFTNPSTAVPMTEIEIGLAPFPVFLRGRVVDREDPATGVAGVVVKLSTPPGFQDTTNEDGRWEFLDPLPLVQTVDLLATPSGGGGMPVPTKGVLLDYTRRMNELVIAV